jgi:hypothetical protein
VAGAGADDGGDAAVGQLLERCPVAAGLEGDVALAWDVQALGIRDAVEAGDLLAKSRGVEGTRIHAWRIRPRRGRSGLCPAVDAAPHRLPEAQLRIWTVPVGAPILATEPRRVAADGHDPAIDRLHLARDEQTAEPPTPRVELDRDRVRARIEQMLDLVAVGPGEANR